MIELTNDSLNFSFPEVHAEAECRIEFQRTLRIPDDIRAALGRAALAGRNRIVTGDLVISQAVRRSIGFCS